MINYVFLMNIFFNMTFCENLYYNLTKTSPTEENIHVCSLLIEDAKSLNVPVEIALSVAWEESRFTHQLKLTSSRCVGPMQIKVEYWCPNRKGKITVTKADGLISKCDPYFHGVRALKYYLRRFKPQKKAICFYNDSRKPECKKDYMSPYVKSVYSKIRKVKKLMRKKYYKEGFSNR